MRTAAAAVLLVAFAWATAAPADAEGEKSLLRRQKDILKLFAKVYEPKAILQHEKIVASFKWEDVLPKLKDPAAAERLLEHIHHNVLLPRNKDFSLFYPKHSEQMVQVVNVLSGVTDFEIFYKVAVWLRYHLNVGLFTCALRVVLMHRADTKDVILPPAYEVRPQLFITSDVMQAAYDACLRGVCFDERQPYVVSANYTGFPSSSSPEAGLSYLREDVGLSSYMTSMNLLYAPWLNNTEWQWPALEHRGELYYFLVRNLLARYDLERLSNHLPPVEPIDLREPVEEGYDPKLRLLSGLQMTPRPEGLLPRRTDVVSVDDVVGYEMRVRDAAATGLFLKNKTMTGLEPETAVNALGFLLLGGPDSPAPNYYGMVPWALLALFGHIADPQHKHQMALSALGVHLAMYRDPLYYRITKRVYGIFDVYKNNQPPYQAGDLRWDGVEIKELKVDKLVTFFDKHDVRLDNAIPLAKFEDMKRVNVVARQPRLNHKPFSYSIKVSSDKERKALVRVFLGPAGDWPGSSIRSEEDTRHQFLVIDAFHTKLSPGDNDLVRHSRQMLGLAEEPFTLRELHRRVEAALEGKEKFVVAEEKWRREGYPHRLLLPRGRPAGLSLQLFVIVTDTHDITWPGEVFSDGRDPFFPFDRRVFFWELRSMPNARFLPITIHHRHAEGGKASEA